MSEAYTGEIRMFGGNFAPMDWAMCNGQPLAIAQNTELFALIATTFGGDGATVFNLPDLQGRLPVGQGAAPGLTPRPIGEKGGVETVTVQPNQAAHGHALNAFSSPGTTVVPQGAQFANTGSVFAYNSSLSAPSALNAATVTLSGGNQPHDNIMPSLCINFIMCLYGIFPQQN